MQVLWKPISNIVPKGTNCLKNDQLRVTVNFVVAWAAQQRCCLCNKTRGVAQAKQSVLCILVRNPGIHKNIHLQMLLLYIVGNHNTFPYSFLQMHNIALA